ncbi:hypothetical protein DAPPUDRAFT_267358 [Daphnia pulex]|uniref:Alpha,alpha-trehalose glucohydrolase n=1 Tax=Daphnia pulex TaxID=6669 RepID=E9HWC9_DAPPU|nr:hypothetical protein DAPPUDRAFT_267358 [Daphnia pulex]|eukprot:EFX63951.1 hypothetical protein DAPPUDRAFT_267358 [Daphnia pulex]
MKLFNYQNYRNLLLWTAAACCPKRGVIKRFKKFVDTKLRFNPKIVSTSFSQFMTDTENQPTKEELQEFVDSNFEADEGLEFHNWDSSDWISDPQFLSQINNSEFRNWDNRFHEYFEATEEGGIFDNFEILRQTRVNE